MFPALLHFEVRAMMAGVVERHRKELGNPPEGILDVVCADGQCRICCDWIKHCSCNSTTQNESDWFDVVAHGASAQLYEGV